MADLLALISVEPGRRNALDWFIGSCLYEGGVWESPRTSDGIHGFERVIERGPDALRVAGRIWEIDQSLHTFWLELTRDAGSDRFRWVLYFDVVEASARLARNALHDHEDPEAIQWRTKLVGDATVQDDKLTIVPGSIRAEVRDIPVLRYLCVARLNGADRVFFWESEDGGLDRVVVDEEGFVRSFPTTAAAREAAAAQRLDVSPDDASTYDLDAIEQWCRSDADVRDCTELLRAWNLLVDLPDGENLFRAADARALGLYDKLFQGCNLLSIAPSDEHDVPVWTAPETAALKHVLLLGLAELRARLR